MSGRDEAEVERLRKHLIDACHADRDGDCYWQQCPQIRDGEPKATGRTCPGRWWTDDDEY